MVDRKELKELLKKGDYRVYTILRHVSRSGMFRIIDCFVIVDNSPLWIGASVAKILGFKYDFDRQGIKISGCGSDMGYEIVYGLSCELYCKERYEHDKAYTLKHSWL